MKDNLSVRCGSNVYLVAILHGMKGRNILLVPGNGWGLQGIWDTPLFLSLYGPLWRCQGTGGCVKCGWMLLRGESYCPLGLGQF